MHEHKHHGHGHQVADVIFEDRTKRAFEMTDVSRKPSTRRRAIASGKITMGKAAFKRLHDRTLPKGDALILAEVAGITACKRTSDIIPLCHPLPLDKATITLTSDEATSTVTATCAVSCFAPTGVEMEALSGVNGALLGLYDLIKGVDAALTISGIHLEVKEGGKSGLWIHPDETEKWSHLQENQPLEGFKAAIITLSDRASKGVYEDISGPATAECLTGMGAEVTETAIIADDEKQLIDTLDRLTSSGANFIVTTGGTGMSNRDITAKTLQKIATKVLPGFGELLRQSGAQYTKFSWLSGSLGAIYNGTLIVALPGNPKAVKEGLQALSGILPHTIETIMEK